MRKIESLASSRFLPIVGEAKGRVLAEEVRKARPKRALEIGTLIGYSAIVIARELPPQSTLTTIEVHSEEAKQAEENLKKAGLGGVVRVVVGDALHVIPTLEGEFDFAFLDAAKDEYLGYLELLEDRMPPGSVVVADNAGIFADEIADYLEHVRSGGRWKSRFVRVGGDGMEISRRL